MNLIANDFQLVDVQVLQVLEFVFDWKCVKLLLLWHVLRSGDLPTANWADDAAAADAAGHGVGRRRQTLVLLLAKRQQLFLLLLNGWLIDVTLATTTTTGSDGMT